MNDLSEGAVIFLVFVWPITLPMVLGYLLAEWIAKKVGK
jgi:hypothetical protein